MFFTSHITTDKFWRVRKQFPVVCHINVVGGLVFIHFYFLVTGIDASRSKLFKTFTRSFDFFLQNVLTLTSVWLVKYILDVFTRWVKCAFRNR